MGTDPGKAALAKQNILDAEARTKAAGEKLEEESIRVRKSGDDFYGNLALFAGGTIALSVTFLGYLKNIPGKPVLCPKALIVSWMALLVCVVASLFSVLFNSHYAHYARLGFYVKRLIEQNETQAEEIDNLLIVNLNAPGEKEKLKDEFTNAVDKKREDATWARTWETIFSRTWKTLCWAAALTFLIGLGSLTFFAMKNM